MCIVQPYSIFMQINQYIYLSPTAIKNVLKHRLCLKFQEFFLLSLKTRKTLFIGINWLLLYSRWNVLSAALCEAFSMRDSFSIIVDHRKKSFSTGPKWHPEHKLIGESVSRTDGKESVTHRLLWKETVWKTGGSSSSMWPHFFGTKTWGNRDSWIKTHFKKHVRPHDEDSRQYFRRFLILSFSFL